MSVTAHGKAGSVRPTQRLAHPKPSNPRPNSLSPSTLLRTGRPPSGGLDHREETRAREPATQRDSQARAAGPGCLRDSTATKGRKQAGAEGGAMAPGGVAPSCLIPESLQDPHPCVPDAQLPPRARLRWSLPDPACPRSKPRGFSAFQTPRESKFTPREGAAEASVLEIRSPKPQFCLPNLNKSYPRTSGRTSAPILPLHEPFLHARSSPKRPYRTPESLVAYHGQEPPRAEPCLHSRILSAYPEAPQSLASCWGAHTLAVKLTF